MEWLDTKLVEVKYLSDYRAHVRYANALEADVDFSDLLGHPFYAPLKDKKRFAQLKVDEEVSVIVWPDDIDVAPEWLYERALTASKNKDMR